MRAFRIFHLTNAVQIPVNFSLPKHTASDLLLSSLAFYSCMRFLYCFIYFRFIHCTESNLHDFQTRVVNSIASVLWLLYIIQSTLFNVSISLVPNLFSAPFKWLSHLCTQRTRDPHNRLTKLWPGIAAADSIKYNVLQSRSKERALWDLTCNLSSNHSCGCLRFDPSVVKVTSGYADQVLKYF